MFINLNIKDMFHTRICIELDYKDDFYYIHTMQPAVYRGIAPCNG